MEGHGLTEAFGHFSTRLDNPSDILITPAKGPGTATADELLTFSIEGKRLDEKADIAAALETPMHLAIYRAYPEVNAICRTHSPHAVSYGVLKKPLHSSHGFGLMLGRTVPVHPESDLIHTEEMGDALARSLKNSKGILLHGNGALAVGVSIEEAVVHAIYLEETARIALHALQAGIEVGWNPSAAKVRERWHSNELKRTWTYFAKKYANVEA